MVDADSVCSRRVRYIVKFANLRFLQMLCTSALANLLFFTISIVLLCSIIAAISVRAFVVTLFAPSGE